MPQPDPAKIVTSLRKLNSVCQSGGTGAFGAFHKVLSKLLHLSIMKQSGHLSLVGTESAGGAAQKLIRGSNGPLPLMDGNYLRLYISLFIEETEEGKRFKTWQSSFQYQRDEEGNDWIFRYDYLRSPKEGQEHVPSAHLQIQGEHERVHFPTMRVPLEAIVRCLANDFKVPCRESVDVWQHVLHHTELDFLEIHHPPTHCPPPS